MISISMLTSSAILLALYIVVAILSPVLFPSEKNLWVIRDGDNNTLTHAGYLLAVSIIAQSLILVAHLLPLGINFFEKSPESILLVALLYGTPFFGILFPVNSKS